MPSEMIIEEFRKLLITALLRLPRLASWARMARHGLNKSFAELFEEATLLLLKLVAQVAPERPRGPRIAHLAQLVAPDPQVGDQDAHQVWLLL